MKTKLRLYLILLSILCSLNACSRGLVDEPKTKDNNTRLSSDTCMIRLSLEGKLNEARYLDYKVDPKGLPKVHLSTPFIPIHCVVRCEDPNIPATFITAEFKVKGDNQLKLELSEIRLRANQQDFSPDGGHRWYLMALIGGQLNEGSGRVHFDSGASPLKRVTVGHSIGLEVPYISQWVELELRKQPNGSYDAGAKEKLTFRPQGTLFRIRASNALPYAHIQVYGYEIQSRICDSKGSFNLNISYGEPPQWSFDDELSEQGWVRKYELEQPTRDMSAGEDDDAYYYLWMMPNRSSLLGAYALSVTKATVRDRVSEQQRHTSSPLFSILGAYITPPSKTLRDGICLTIHPRILPAGNPLEQVDEMNYTGAYPHAARTRDFSNTTPQLYYYWEAEALGKKIPGWRLPTERDWTTVMGAGFAFEREHGGRNSERSKESEEVQEGGEKRTIQSSYKRDFPHSICYATRFQASSNSRCYSAWRYSTEGGRAVVKSCYLGPGAHEGIDDISSESWWGRHTNVIVRHLPMAGRWTPQNKDPHHPFESGVAFYYWTSTLCYPDHHQYNNYHKIRGLNRFWFAHGTFGAPSNYACVRLFKDL